MAQKLTKVAESTTLANTDTMIVVDEAVQNSDGTTGALKRIKKEDTGFALASSTKSKIDTKADAIAKSANGSIASFLDGGDGLLMKSLKVNIVPKQAGTGDPSPNNRRAISGWDSVKTNATGKNLCPTNAPNSNGTWNASTEELTVSGTTSYNSAYYRLVLKAGNTYTFSAYAKQINGRAKIGLRIGTNTQLVVSSEDIGEPRRLTFTYTPVEDIDARFALFSAWGTAVQTSVTYGEIQIEVGTTATDHEYHAYQGTSYPISLGQTVYGGTLDVVSGVLTIDRALVDLGSINWSKTTNSTKTYFQTSSQIADMKKSSGVGVLQGLLCSNYTEQPWTRALDYASVDKAICVGWANKSYIAIADSTHADLTASAFKTAMNGVQLVYELATPTEIQLTPTEVNTLLGSNNIWSESGTVEVQYRADSTLAYNELLSLIASLS